MLYEDYNQQSYLLADDEEITMLKKENAILSNFLLLPVFSLASFPSRVYVKICSLRDARGIKSQNQLIILDIMHTHAVLPC